VQNLARRRRAAAALGADHALVNRRELLDRPPEAGGDGVAFFAGRDRPTRMSCLAIDLAQQIDNVLRGQTDDLLGDRRPFGRARRLSCGITLRFS
jgi:hypothetical protein